MPDWLYHPAFHRRMVDFATGRPSEVGGAHMSGPTTPRPGAGKNLNQTPNRMTGHRRGNRQNHKGTEFTEKITEDFQALVAQRRRRDRMIAWGVSPRSHGKINSQPRSGDRCRRRGDYLSPLWGSPYLFGPGPWG